MSNLDTINNFLTCKFFVRFALVLFAPFVFYIVGNLTFIDFGSFAGITTTLLSIFFAVVFGMLWCCMFIASCVNPYPKEAEISSASMNRRKRFASTYTHFMTDMKHPDVLNRCDIINEDEVNQLEKNKKNELGEEDTKKIINY